MDCVIKDKNPINYSKATNISFNQAETLFSCDLELFVPQTSNILPIKLYKLECMLNITLETSGVAKVSQIYEARMCKNI
jgi:hypothetical protein